VDVTRKTNNSHALPVVGLNAEIDGSVTMSADASGTLDSGKITLFEVGVPGLDFPGFVLLYSCSL
jgi:hypothetical protein